MAERIKVTGAELREIFMTDDAVGLQVDMRANVRIVLMADGTKYEAPFVAGGWG